MMNFSNSLTLFAAAADRPYVLTIPGWFVMIVSVGFVTLLLAWCIWKVLTTPGSSEHVHSPIDIDPGDRE